VVGGTVDTIQEGLLYQTITNLSAGSLSEKVTIVTHSNGGLLAKYFLDVLAKNNDPLLAKIDNLFLVGVPQSGTPDSVVTLLHGTELVGGILLDNETSRNLVNNMPVAHHLLPSEAYFASDVASDFPVVRFQPGTLTDSWIAEYGTDITTLGSLHAFMSNTSGRPKPDTDDLLQPETVDPFLLQYAQVTHVIQSDWQPPKTLQVHQLSGTGIYTPVSIMYFTDQECITRSILSGFQCTEYGPKLGYRITKLNVGDETVVFNSAQAMDDDKQIISMIINLSKHNASNFKRVHRDLLEIADVRSYISDILQSKPEIDYEYLSRTPLPSQSEQKLVFQLHSPLDMKIISGGQELSSSTNEINGSAYERFGEVQYISIPHSVGDFELILNGLSTGSFTLEIEEWQGSTMQSRTDFVAVPSIIGTQVRLEVIDGDVPRTFTIDYDGDGEVDAVVAEDGSLEVLSTDPEIEIEPPTVVEQIGGSSSFATRVDRRTPVGQVAGITTSTMTEVEQLEELTRLLTRLSELLTLIYKI